jgi:uncharacterized membrane protein
VRPKLEAQPALEWTAHLGGGKMPAMLDFMILVVVAVVVLVVFLAILNHQREKKRRMSTAVCSPSGAANPTVDTS